MSPDDNGKNENKAYAQHGVCCVAHSFTYNDVKLFVKNIFGKNLNYLQ